MLSLACSQDQNFAALVLVNLGIPQRCYTLNSYQNALSKFRERAAED